MTTETLAERLAAGDTPPGAAAPAISRDVPSVIVTAAVDAVRPSL